MDLLERIKEIASKQGISMRQIEIGCGFSNGSLSKWSSQSPSVDKVLSVANYLNISIQYLVTGEAEKKLAIDLTPAEKTVYEQLQTMSETEKYKLAGALPFIKMMQDPRYLVPPSEREHFAVSLFTDSTSRE